MNPIRKSTLSALSVIASRRAQRANQGNTGRNWSGLAGPSGRFRRFSNQLMRRLLEETPLGQAVLRDEEKAKAKAKEVTPAQKPLKPGETMILDQYGPYIRDTTVERVKRST